MIELVPMVRDEANALIREWHRHHKPVRNGHRFAIGAICEAGPLGVVLVGNPIAPEFQTGRIFEVLRLATPEDAVRYVAGRLLGAARRTAIEMGFRRGVSYTRIDEPGTCYRAAGWWPTAKVDGREHDTGNRAGRWLPGIAEPTTEIIDRVRWETGPDAIPELPELARLGRRTDKARGER